MIVQGYGQLGHTGLTVALWSIIDILRKDKATASKILYFEMIWYATDSLGGKEIGLTVA